VTGANDGRVVAVAQRLSAHWGQQVFIEAADHTRVRLWLAGHETRAESPAVRP